MWVAPPLIIWVTVPSTPLHRTERGIAGLAAANAVEVAEELVGPVDEVDDHGVKSPDQEGDPGVRCRGRTTGCGRRSRGMPPPAPARRREREPRGSAGGRSEGCPAPRAPCCCSSGSRCHHLPQRASWSRGRALRHRARCCRPARRDQWHREARRAAAARRRPPTVLEIRRRWRRWARGRRRRWTAPRHCASGVDWGHAA